MFNAQIFENSNSGNASAINIPNNQNNDNLAIPQPIDITHQRNSFVGNPRFRRESIAHSQGMGGVSWGSVTIGSWLKDEVMMIGNGGYNNNQNANNFCNSAGNINPNFNNNANFANSNFNNVNLSNNMGSGLINPRRGSMRHQAISMSPSNHTSYMPDLEADYCKDYSCCGELLPTLHDLLRHYEEAHISPSPPIEQNEMLVANRNKNNLNNVHNIMETVSTNEVFLNNQNANVMHQTARMTNDSSMGSLQNLNVQMPQLGIQDTINQSTISQNSHNPSEFQHHQPLQHGQLHRNQQEQRKVYQQHLQQQQHQRQVHPQQVHQVNSRQASRSGTPHFDDEDAMYIDDPARHLYVMENNEHKPYRCPVIGCDKTYKNQNGLKYHRAHGHQNQKLKENPNGTISIIDPASNTPYLDGAGIEKDKPYRCEVCGKRYKNLNGLKYHRGHTTH